MNKAAEAASGRSAKEWLRMSSATEIVEPCPSCGKKLRWPSHLGRLIVICPLCRHRWDWQLRAPPAVAVRGTDLKPAAIQIVPVLPFENTKEFFAELSKEVKTGQPVTVETQFEKESEFPDELKQYIKAEGEGGAGSAAVSVLRKPVALVPLATVAGASLGLGVVALFGGVFIVGFGVGAVLGLITGAVTTTLSSGSHRIEIVVDV